MLVFGIYNIFSFVNIVFPVFLCIGPFNEIFLIALFPVRFLLWYLVVICRESLFGSLKQS